MNKHSTRTESIDSSDDHTSDNKTNNSNLKKIFIGNLPFSITKHELEDLFGSVRFIYIAYNNILILYIIH